MEIKDVRPVPRYCTLKRLKATALEKNTPFLQPDLQTENTKYLLQYRTGMQYVGETEQPFNRRINGHRSDYKCKPDLPLNSHLRSYTTVNEKSIEVIL